MLELIMIVCGFIVPSYRLINGTQTPVQDCIELMLTPYIIYEMLSARFGWGIHKK